MQIRKAAVVAAALALTCGVALAQAGSDADDGTAPPQGITPAHITLEALRAAHRAAVRGAAPSHAFSEHWTIVKNGENGTEDVARIGNDERDDTTIAGIHEASGTSGGKRWNQNVNGEVTWESGIHRRTETNAAAMHAFDAQHGVRVLGQVTSPVTAYVVEVNPSGGRLEYVYVDAKTYLIDRTETAYLGSRVIRTLDDYRVVDGTMMPAHVHTTNAREQNEEDDRLASTSATVDPSVVAVPTGAAPFALSASGPLPAHVYSDRVIMTLRVNGRAFNLQLDSGASETLVDSDLIDALRIPVVQKARQTTAGTYQAGKAVIPTVEMGPVTFHHFVVTAAPYTSYADERTPVAGLLGFDFIDGAVVHIDYFHGTAEVLDPSTFTPPAGATSLPVDLDDFVPIVNATIGAAKGSFILDTGADRSALFSGFTAAHPHDVADLGLGTQIRDAFPFEQRFYGVGGRVAYRPTQVGPFRLGAIAFDRWLFDATYGAAAFEDEDYDGLIGQDVMRYFDVYLDYPHGKVHFVPNQRYRDRFGTAS